MIKKFNDFINESTSFNKDVKEWIVEIFQEWLNIASSFGWEEGEDEKTTDLEEIIVKLENKTKDEYDFTEEELKKIIKYLKSHFDGDLDLDFDEDDTYIYEYPPVLFEYDDDLSKDKLKDVLIEIYNYFNDDEDSQLKPVQNMGLL